VRINETEGPVSTGPFVLRGLGQLHITAVTTCLLTGGALNSKINQAVGLAVGVDHPARQAAKICFDLWSKCSIK
jgi:hypothetical protein